MENSNHLTWGCMIRAKTKGANRPIAYLSDQISPRIYNKNRKIITQFYANAQI